MRNRYVYVALALVLLSFAGCAPIDPDTDPGLEFLHGTRSNYDGPQSCGYRCLVERSVPGWAGEPERVVPANTVLAGSRNPVEWLLLPEFGAVFAHTSGLKLVKRPGDRTFTSVTQVGEGEDRVTSFTPTPYTELAQIYYWDLWAAQLPDGPDGQRMIGVVAPQNVRHQVEVAPCEPWSAAVERLSKGAFVIHEKNGDRLYDENGAALSPELPRLNRLKLPREPHEEPGLRGGYLHQHFAVSTGPSELGVWWPVLGDGTIAPKPADLLGVRFLESADNGCVRRWQVWWRTPEGERCALVPGQEELIDDPQAFIASRAEAKWVELQSVGWDIDPSADWPEYRIDPPCDHYDVARAAGRDDYTILCGTRPVFSERFATAEEARAFLVARNRPGWEEHERRRKRGEEASRVVAAWHARQDAVARQREADAKAAQERRAWEAYQAKERRVDELIAAGRLAEARDQAWQTSTRALARVVLAALQRDQVHLMSNMDLSVAADECQPDDANRIRTARAARGAASDGPSSSGGPSDPGGVNAAMDHLEQVRRQNMDAWLRGAQNWGGPRD